MKDEHLEMKLPLDLFKFSALEVCSKKDVDELICLIHTLFYLKYLADRVLLIFYCKLTNKEGLYFGKHYMSDQIWFEKIYVRPEFIESYIKASYRV